MLLGVSPPGRRRGHVGHSSSCHGGLEVKGIEEGVRGEYSLEDAITSGVDSFIRSETL